MTIIHKRKITSAVMIAPLLLTTIIGLQSIGLGNAGASVTPLTATGCTGYFGNVGSVMCMTVSGTGLNVGGMSNEYEGGFPYSQFCDVAAYWRGDSQKTGWTDWFSGTFDSCYVEVNDISYSGLNVNMVNNSSFYGWYKSATYNGDNWGPADQETIEN